MKNILLVLLVSIASISNLTAQQTFEKAHRKLTFWPEVARSCDNDGEGGYVVATGEKLLNINQRTNAFYRMNAFGDTLWYFTYPLQGGSNFQLAQRAKDGNFYIAGIEPDTSGNSNYMWWIIKVDTLGNFLWKKNYIQVLNDFINNSNAMDIQENGDIFLLLYDRVVIRIDTAGSLIETTVESNFSSDSHAHLKSNIAKVDSFYYFLGDYGNLPFRIMKSNLTGDTIRSIPIQSDTIGFVTEILKQKNSNYFTCSFALPLINGKHPFTFSKFDSTGAKIWNKFYDHIDGSFVLPTCYKTLSNGSNVAAFIPATNGFNPPTGRAALFCFNDNGDSLWYKQLSPTDTTVKTEIYDVIATPDSGLLAVGQILFSNGQQKSYVIKLDANGNLFNPLAVLEKKKESYLHLYPNPANGYSGIHYLGSEKNAAVCISNIVGETIETLQLSKQDEYLVLNTSNYKPGIYFCSIKVEGRRMLTKKLLVIH